MTNDQLEDILPLSPMQEGMLFHSLLDAQPGVDFEQLSYRFDGALDVGALNQSWQAVLRRHSALRARFAWRGMDQPLQLIEREVRLPFEELDWTGSPDYQERLESWLIEDRAVGVPLDRAPLLRITVMRLAEQQHLMVVSFHHLLLDGWSMRLVLRDLIASYFTERLGGPAPAPAPKYRDFLSWLKRQDLDQAREFWQRELATFSTPTQVVGERRTAASGYGTVEISFDQAETEQLKKFAREQRITMNTLVQGAWAMLISRYSGTDDVVFGATMSTRPAEVNRIESIVGLMINTLPVRVRLAALDEVGDWLRRLQQSQLELRQYDFSPLVLAQTCSGVPQGVAMFDSIVVFENYPKNSDDQGLPDGLTLTPLGAEERNGYPLSVVAAVREKLLIDLTYDRSRLSPDRIRRLAGHLRTLLESLATNPFQLVGDLPMLTADEREQIVRGWNQTATSYPADRCIHELFEARAVEAPDALAITGVDGNQLTYRELNERANQLAHRLRQLGARPELTLGICSSASVSGLIGLLGILKSGAAYLPLDPEHPAQRLAFMITDTDARLLVSEPDSAPMLPPEFAAQGRLVLLDPADPATAAMPKSNPTALSCPANLAYVMYTSGSTGKPKGVLVHHQGLVNYLWWAIEGYGVGGASGAPWSGSIAYDLGMPNYFLPLIAGKDVTVLPTERSLDSLRTALLKPHDFSLLKITPGHLDVLRHSLAGRELDSVRTYVVGADEVKPETVAAWQAIAPRSRVINEYGPTETVVGCSIYVADEDFDPTVPVPIGRPIANIRMYVLDSRLEPVPAGVTGELFIGGDGVARGYLNRPRVTAERFVPDPFGTGRLYRTGDIARFRDDGMLEFLGRADHQVKIRGYRVELGEIEARLLAREELAEVVVVAREYGPGDRRLVAYLVATGQQPSVGDLRSWIEEVMPPYMVPSAFCYLPTLPLSHNGKVDRSALPEPDAGSRAMDTNTIAPRTEIEELIAGMWRDVLGLDRVGVFDDFFELGGHSLLATQVVSRLSGVGRGEVPLRMLFDNPTIAAQAEWLAGSAAARDGAAIQPATRDKPLPLSFAQQRLWFLDQLNPGSAEYVVPLAWRLHGQLDVGTLHEALRTVVHRHEILRTTFDAGDDGICQHVQQPIAFDLPVIEAEADEVRPLLQRLARRPFDLSAGLPWRASLVRDGDSNHILLLATHHILIDGWSAQNLVAEIAECYRALQTGTDPQLPVLTVQYGDYAVWQRGWLQESALGGQLEYWRKKLDGFGTLDLPSDRPRAALGSTEAGTVDLSVPAEVAAGLHELARKQRVTLYMVMLAAVQTLLGRYTQQDDVLIGTPIANRNRAETEALIGFFVNTLVMRTDLSGNPTFVELLRQVRETTLDAYENQDLPFEQLVEELNPVRDLSQSPIFQVLLQVNNAPNKGWQLPGISIENYPLSTGEAKFDLNLTFADDAEGLRGTIRYRTALFDRERIERLAGHLIQLLAAVAAEPRIRLAEVPILTAAEQAELHGLSKLSERSSASTTIELARSFNDQARRGPAAVAVIDGGHSLTFGELAARSSRLAHRLVEAGAAPEQVVAIALPVSVELVVAMLGCLRSGAAFLVLDPTESSSRQLELLRAGSVSQVVCGADQMAKHAAWTGLPVLAVSEDVAEDKALPELPVLPAQTTAYLSVTAGSTGPAKLAVVTHAAVAHLLSGYLLHYPLALDEVCCLPNSLGQADSVTELLAALLGGRPVALVRSDQLSDAAELVRRLAQASVSRVCLTPTVLRAVLTQPELDRLLPTLRMVAVSGEPLDPGTVASFACALPGRRLVNRYGAAEVSGQVASSVVTPEHALVPLGEPIDGVAVAVLDHRLEPVPIGISGELYLGGPALARGYAGQPSRTAAQFVPDHLNLGGGRLYRTGDRARWLQPGVLGFDGRADSQLEVRGARVEATAIETALRAVPGIAEAAVIDRSQPDRTSQLVGYLVAAGGEAPAAEELRIALEHRLPAYLIPARFDYVAELPLTGDGRIDRTALATISSAQPGDALKPSRARTELERLVTETWSAVLGVSQIGVNDNFFDLGGHSMLAAQAIAQLRNRGFSGLPLTTLFTRPTVAELAAHLASLSNGTAELGAAEFSALVPLNDGPESRTLFCVHEGTGSITGYYELARILQPELRLVGIAFDDAELATSSEDPIKTMARDYVELIQQVQPDGPYLLLGWSFGGLVGYEMAAQLLSAGHQVEWVGAVDSVALAPETTNRTRVDLVLEELLAWSGQISEQDWTALAGERLSDHLRQLDLRQEHVELGKQGLEAVLRRNQYFGLAKRRYRPSSSPLRLTAIRAEDGNWDLSWFTAWSRFAPNAEILEVGGNHLSVMERPHLDRVVEVIRDRIGLKG